MSKICDRARSRPGESLEVDRTVRSSHPDKSNRIGTSRSSSKHRKIKSGFISEGYCAVFPAVERRLNFSEADMNYLANLCHNCAECYYACQYAPPHEFAVNVPRALAGIRTRSYRKYAWPGFGPLGAWLAVAARQQRCLARPCATARRWAARRAGGGGAPGDPPAPRGRRGRRQGRGRPAG